ncbi:hypothetical protein CAC42_2472 [Sphaceloma murrayae]|uniref:Sorting nexin MVP1 n=1 Tax=Sphaceloma murrayae TaxID=2082308 RepID=A0A2K1QW53_9PEZI|nr:hypothetical protein CAC42_2472 [Sphaceloma murrayae]
MSLFGDSPPSSSPQKPTTTTTTTSSSLFDSAPQSKSHSSGLFADDDPQSSPWDMPTPKKAARRNPLKTLLPSSAVPDMYIEAFDALLEKEGSASGDVGAATVKAFLATAGIGAGDQERIFAAVVGEGKRIGREEGNVMLAMVGLAQEGEEVGLDAVDERRKRLPIPKLPDTRPQRQAEVPRPNDTLQAGPGAMGRTQTAGSFGALDSDPWGSPAMHKGHNHQEQGGYTNGSQPEPTRTTSTFTTSTAGGDSVGASDFAPSSQTATGDGAPWGVDGGFAGNEGGFGGPPASNGNGGPGRSSRPLGSGKKTGSSIEEEITVNLLEEKEGMFLFQHRNYEVASTRKNSKVIRRYSDFVWLLDCLHKRYPFRQLPLLPPKRVAINGNHLAADTSFLEKRRRGLARFANALVRHPVLGQEQLVIMFLTVPTELAVWRKQATISVQEEFTGKSLPSGLEDSLPSTLPQLFDTVRVGVKRSAEFYIDLCNRIEKLTKYNAGLAGEYMRLSQALENLAEASQETYAIDTNDVPLLNEGFKAVSKHMDANRSILEDEGRAWDLGALEDFKRQRDCLVSMRDLFDRRDRYAKDNIPQLERRIDSNSNKLVALRNKPDAKPSEVEKLEVSITNDKQSIVDQHARGVFIKECVRDELVYFNRSQYHVSRMHQDWSQERVKYSELAADNWRGLADEVEGMPTGD